MTYKNKEDLVGSINWTITFLEYAKQYAEKKDKDGYKKSMHIAKTLFGEIGKTVKSKTSIDLTNIPEVSIS